MSKKHGNGKNKRHARDDRPGAKGAAPNEVGQAGVDSQPGITREDYAAQLHLLQVELVKLQRHFIGCGDRILVLLEGRDPLKQWKTSPIDAVAVKRWKAYSDARDAMLMRTHTAIAPWRVIRTDDKRLARLNLMRDILSRLPYAGKKTKLVQPDTEIAFEFTPECIDAKRLAA